MLIETTPQPRGFALTLADAQEHVGTDAPYHDALLMRAIEHATEIAERRLRRDLIERTWRLELDAFPAAAIDLERTRVREVTSFGYINATLDPVVIDPADLVVTHPALSGPTTIALADAWPEEGSTIVVEFSTGYGPDPEDVPARVRNWMLLQVGSIFRQREAFIVGAPVAEIPNDWVDGMLEGERLSRYVFA